MRIAIDLRCLAGSKELKGVSQYTKHLVSELIKQTSEISFLLFPGFNQPRNRIIFEYFPTLPEHSHWIWSSIPMQIVERLWHFGWPPIEYITGPIDLFFEPNFFLPPINNAKSVVTIHDLSFQRHPEWFPKRVASQRIQQLENTLITADHIIAVSHFTASEIRELWPQHREKTSVIHKAAGVEFQPVESEKIVDLARRYHFEDPFFLYTGTIESRKNIEKLISSYLYLRQSGKTKCQLILAGSLGYGSKEILQAAAPGLEKDWIRLIGFLKQEDLPSLYSAAKALCYLSRYEGFGLPPLEALACGTPVLVSDIPVFHEILGPQAHYVSPSNEHEIADGLIDVEKIDKSTANECIAWASRYTWERAASDTLSVFRKIA